METNQKSKNKLTAIKVVVLLVLILLGLLTYKHFKKNSVYSEKNIAQVKSESIGNNFFEVNVELSAEEKVLYDKKMLELANLPVLLSTASSTQGLSAPLPSQQVGGKNQNLWPVKSVYPNKGALLPFNRIVAFYGNLYSKGMGVLGEYPENVMLDKLASEVKKWEQADSDTKVIPALHYIAVVAQAGGGRDGKYRARMPSSEIDKVLEMAKKANAIVFLDVQVGLSNVETEVPRLEKYLKLPNVHLGIDPEFAMQNGTAPGKQIGSLDGNDINFAVKYLTNLVKENNLPPKVLVVHRFTKPMLTNAKNILPTSEVQVVMQMDGFGSRASKINTYKQYIYKEPVQFTGFKLFYKNDITNGQKILEPEDLLKLTPRPSYIQFQ